MIRLTRDRPSASFSTTASRQSPRTTPSSGTSSSAGKVCSLVSAYRFRSVEGLDDRAVAPVVRAEVQGLEELRHHAPVMALVGVADHGAQGGPIGRSRGLAIPGPGRAGSVRRRPGRRPRARSRRGRSRAAPASSNRRLCLPVTRFRSSSSSRSTRRSARAPIWWMVSIRRSTRSSVNWRAAEVHEGREPGEPRRFGVSAQLVGGLDRDAPATTLELARQHPAEHVGRH